MSWELTDRFAIRGRLATVVFVVAGGIGLGLVSSKVLDVVVALGYRLPQEDLMADYVKGVVWAFVLGLSILAWPVSADNKRALLWVWFAKAFVTLSLMLVYEWNYPLDAHGYFDESRQRTFEWVGFRFSGEHSGTENMTNLCWLLQQLVPNSFHGLKVSFSMMGLVAVYLSYRAAVLFLGREDRRLFFLLAFWPTVLFWSSILGKDPLVLLGISLYAYGAIGWIHLKQVRFLPVLAFGVTLAIAMRIWLGVVMFIPLAIILLRGKFSIGAKIIFGVLIGCSLWVAVDQFAGYFLLETAEDVMDKAEFLGGGFGEKVGGSTQEYKEYGGFGGMVAFLPLGIFTALFRPLPGEVLNAFGLFASLENVVTLSLVFLAVKRTRWRELKEPLVTWALAFLIGWSILYAFVSSYNLGTASRYRLQILPIMVCLLLYLARRRSAVPSLTPDRPDNLGGLLATGKTLRGQSS